MEKDKDLIIFNAEDGSINLNVTVNEETVWLSLNQISKLFKKDKSTISRHIKNIFKEQELVETSVVANFATTADDGKTYNVTYYNLDVIISVGYRVKSKRGVEFRKWANRILKDYIIKGISVNDKRLKELNKIISIAKRSKDVLESNQILSVIERYTEALSLLDDYDHKSVKKPVGNDSLAILTYDECRNIISQLQFNRENILFGNEKDESFKSSIAAIYQTFGGEEVYPSAEEKAANLIYFITKNHSFSDGNKRIAAAIFLYFLDKNGMLFLDGKKKVEDSTLVAITIMIAESKAGEKEIMIRLIMNFLIDNKGETYAFK